MSRVVNQCSLSILIDKRLISIIAVLGVSLSVVRLE